MLCDGVVLYRWWVQSLTWWWFFSLHSHTEIVTAHGEGASIPDNAQISRIHHPPGQDQLAKVNDVFKASAAMEAAAGSGNQGDGSEAHAVLAKDDANMADVYFLG